MCSSGKVLCACMLCSAALVIAYVMEKCAISCTWVHLFTDLISTARCSNASMVLAVEILSGSPSCVLYDKTKEHTADILMPYERSIHLLFGHQQRLVGDFPFHLKFVLKVTHSVRKHQFPLITSQPQDLEKKVQLSRIGSWPRAF